MPGLGDARCFSFESVNFPGQFLRHQDSRVRNAPDGGSALMRADATFCARPGLSGQGVTPGWLLKALGAVPGIDRLVRVVLNRAYRSGLRREGYEDAPVTGP